MRLHEGESPFGDGHVEPLRHVADLERRRTSVSGPYLLAIDGRGSNGKSMLATRIAALMPNSGIVRTDDIAWFHRRFGWDDLLIQSIIETLRRGESVAYRPPAWEALGRDGCIAVAGGSR